MMTTTLRKIAPALVFAGALLISARTATATTVTFDVVVNTAPLMGNPPGSFYLDFQLNGVQSNTAVISNFQFNGGSAFGAPTLIGGASGSLTTGLSLSDTGSFFNEFFQQFTAGNSLRFTVNVSNTYNPLVDPTPDAFSFAILDSNQLNIPTTGLGDALFLFNLRPNAVRADLQGFSGTGAFSAVNAQPVPEPGTITLLVIGLGGIALAIGMRRSTASF